MPVRTLLLSLAAIALAGCNADTGAGKPAPAGAAAPPDAGGGKALVEPSSDAGRSPGKPAAPVEIGYRVLGAPLVGQPVAIEVELTSPLSDRQMRMSYSISDPASLAFAESQPRAIELRMDGDRQRANRQVTVVPQREGRLYLNVTVEVDTEAGIMLKSMSVPLSVGYAEGAAAVNGELEETADGDTVVSMPADEN